jgi:branched-chain amino acid transport system ATP-binding protein
VSTLAVEHLRKTFGGVHAVDDVSFGVERGELVALIGPNGAGKTTCFNLINGQLAPDEGRVLLDGKRVDGKAAHVVARLGLARTFQVAATFASMTVRENVRLALLARAGRAKEATSLASSLPDAPVDALLARVGCADLADTHCAVLAYGDAKRVELALALAGEPRVLLMDEPTAGMPPRSRARLMQVAADLVKRDRIAVLFTEHDMDIVFAFADRVIVLDDGKIIAQGTPAEVRADARVQEAYLGSVLAEQQAAGATA